MTNILEMVDGILQPMSDADQAAYDARQAGYIAGQANNAIKAQIAALESPTGFTRKQREIILAGTLSTTDSQIAALRAQLK